MTIALRPDEQERLAALLRYDVLDTPREADFDAIAELASQICGMPIAVVNLIGEGRQFFKAEVGLGVRETPLDTSFCGHAILAEDFMMVPDATRDARFDCNPLVTGDPGLRSYAGALLKTPEGLPLGTLCVLGFEPRTLNAHQQAALRTLAGQVMAQLELRRLLKQHEALNLELEQRVADVEAERDRTAMLGREIDHRVMNSLQFVSGLLTMQAKAVGDAEASRQLDIAASRVTTVARVHRHFYLDEAVETTSALDYARRLIDDLAGVIEPCAATLTGEPTPIPTTLVMPLGLITNELVTNAAKHGASRISVEVVPAGSSLSLTVRDDGPGLPANFDPAARTGLGMRVIRSLVAQHGGTFEPATADGGGAVFRVTLG